MKVTSGHRETTNGERQLACQDAKDSIMFATFVALSVKNLGAYTKLGSALLVMSIMGGPIVPAVMGYISDASSIPKAFVVPLICYAYVIYFAVRG
jgi:FHS family L-fucose permease-like MFS transporter